MPQLDVGSLVQYGNEDLGIPLDTYLVAGVERAGDDVTGYILVCKEDSAVYTVSHQLLEDTVVLQREADMDTSLLDTSTDGVRSVFEFPSGYSALDGRKFRVLARIDETLEGGRLRVVLQDVETDKLEVLIPDSFPGMLLCGAPGGGDDD